jgi:hypothetical protein
MSRFPKYAKAFSRSTEPEGDRWRPAPWQEFAGSRWHGQHAEGEWCGDYSMYRTHCVASTGAERNGPRMPISCQEDAFPLPESKQDRS